MQIIHFRLKSNKNSSVPVPVRGPTLEGLRNEGCPWDTQDNYFLTTVPTL